MIGVGGARGRLRRTTRAGTARGGGGGLGGDGLGRGLGVGGIFYRIRNGDDGADSNAHSNHSKSDRSVVFVAANSLLHRRGRRWDRGLESALLSLRAFPDGPGDGDGNSQGLKQPSDASERWATSLRRGPFLRIVDVAGDAGPLRLTLPAPTVHPQNRDARTQGRGHGQHQQG
eukprot:CAMPEP_0198666402 /NCGR_PEP_ID=MMETSP1467-20131203/64494_1 /TAXON_ID=1462469 /ORGANISM="unid. sp., Strain CCMP2135" /LENGTH=172 /DNA_ID=CAMNT_0044403049 /DNA_START=114 /DNA_END=632 /DNA_ORIENTATION=+